MYFDDTLTIDKIEELDSTPILPEERHVFELIGFERSQPDQWRAEGGIKWTFLVFQEDGHTPFVFQDEQYQFFRTTGLTRDGRPNFNVGTYANEWASALLGRQLGVDGHFQVSELRGKRMSALVLWEKQRSDPKKKTVKLGVLRHVPVRAASLAAPSRAPGGQVTADASDEDIDRALVVQKINKSYTRLVALSPEDAKEARRAIDDSDLDEAPLDALNRLAEDISSRCIAALDD